MADLKMKPHESFGTCVKGIDRLVLAQNTVCIAFCGKKVGERCDTGCMKNFARAEQKTPPALGFHVVSNLKEGKQTFDALTINDGETLTTLLLPKDKLIHRMLAAFVSHGLTPAETSVVSLVLEGFTNSEIAKLLFICRQTLKTHLNNINKKVPSSLSIDRLRLHFRLEA